MRIVNDARPFDVGDEIVKNSSYTISSWNPDKRTVNIVSSRGQTVIVPWQYAEDNLIKRK